MSRTYVNNNIKLKSGGGILNGANGLEVDNSFIFTSVLAGENISGATTPVPVFIPSTSPAEALLLTQGTSEGGTSVYANHWCANYFTSGFDDVLSKVVLRLQRRADTIGNFNLMIYAVDGYNKPTGSPLYTSSISVASITKWTWNDYDFVFSSAVLSKFTTYALVVNCPQLDNPSETVLIANNTSTSTVGWFSGDGGYTWSNLPDIYMRIYGFQSGIVAGRLSKSSGNDPLRTRFDGFAITTGNAGDAISFTPDGFISGFSGLTPGAKYYVQDTNGTIGTSAGSTSIIVGVAISATTLMVIKDFSKV